MGNESFFAVVLAYVLQAIIGLIGVAVIIGVPLLILFSLTN